MNHLDWPIQYRINGIGNYVVVAYVPGVGRLTAQDRSLFPATQSVRAQIQAALAARPQEMF
jgi:hypothetical protein